MSSIALPFERQIRNLYFAEKVFSGDAETFATTADVGDVLPIMSADNKSVTFMFKDGLGKVITSDVIKLSNVLYTNIVKPQAKIGKKETFKIGSVVVGKAYNANLKIHFGVSEKVFGTIYATVIAVQGDTPATLAGKLAVQLAENLAADMKTSNFVNTTTTINGVDVKQNKYFNITVASDTITVEEKDWILENYVPGLRAFDQLMWAVEVGTDYFEADPTITKTVIAGKPAKGQGYQMVELERYLVGHRAEFPGKDITLGFHRKFQADVNSQYNVLDVQYFDVPRYDPQRSEKGFSIVSTTLGTVEAILAILAPVATEEAPDPLPEG